MRKFENHFFYRIFLKYMIYDLCICLKYMIWIDLIYRIAMSMPCPRVASPSRIWVTNLEASTSKTWTRQLSTWEFSPQTLGKAKLGHSDLQWAMGSIRKKHQALLMTTVGNWEFNSVELVPFEISLLAARPPRPLFFTFLSVNLSPTAHSSLSKPHLVTGPAPWPLRLAGPQAVRLQDFPVANQLASEVGGAGGVVEFCWQRATPRDWIRRGKGGESSTLWLLSCLGPEGAVRSLVICYMSYIHIADDKWPVGSANGLSQTHDSVCFSNWMRSRYCDIALSKSLITGTAFLSFLFGLQVAW